MIAIIDCAQSNPRELVKAFSLLEHQVQLARYPRDIERATHVVLPGGASFANAMRELESNGMAHAIWQAVEAGKPLLAIDAGFYLLFDSSEESPDTPGLAIVPGAVRRLPNTEDYPAPHVGWRRVSFRMADNDAPRDEGEPPEPADVPRPALCVGLAAEPMFFFQHEYFVEPEDAAWIAATTDYGAKYAAIIGRDNVWGVQFLPECSQAAGRTVLDRFARLNLDQAEPEPAQPETTPAEPESTAPELVELEPTEPEPAAPELPEAEPAGAVQATPVQSVPEPEPAEPEPTESGQPEPAQPEAAQAAPVDAPPAPAEPEPAATEPTEAEQAEAGQSETESTEPAPAESAQAAAVQATPDQAEPEPEAPERAEPEQAEPEQAEVGATESNPPEIDRPKVDPPETARPNPGQPDVAPQ